jgi:hypothetical protein
MKDTGLMVNNMEEENIICQIVPLDSVYGRMENVQNGWKMRIFKIRK